MSHWDHFSGLDQETAAAPQSNAERLRTEPVDSGKEQALATPGATS